MPNIHITWLSKIFNFMIPAFGFVEIAAAIILFKTPNRQFEAKQNCSRILAFFLLFDAMVVHFPFSELERDFAMEMNHFCSDLALLGGLVMLTGYRGD